MSLFSCPELAALNPKVSVRVNEPSKTVQEQKSDPQFFGSEHEVRLACFPVQGDYNCLMPTITEIKKLALDLSEKERAILAAHLLGSLPPVLHDEDEGIAEALRRDAEIEANSAVGLSLEELDQQIERRRT